MADSANCAYAGRMRLRLIILAPFLLFLVLFALSNTAIVPIGLWPTGMSVEAPVSVAILIGMAFAFLLGALMTWLSGLAHRRRARRAEARATALQAELDALRSARPVTVLPPPQ